MSARYYLVVTGSYKEDKRGTEPYSHSLVVTGTKLDFVSHNFQRPMTLRTQVLLVKVGRPFLFGDTKVEINCFLSIKIVE